MLFRKSRKEEVFDLFDGKGSKSEKGLRKVIILSLSFLLLFGGSVMAYTALGGGRSSVQDAPYVIYAKSLDGLKKEQKSLEKKYDEAVKKRDNAKKDMEKYKGEWLKVELLGSKYAKAEKEFKQAEKDIEKYKKSLEEVKKKISNTEYVNEKGIKNPSDSKNNKADAKSKADENSKKAKSSANYNGGTGNGVKVDEKARNYVKDSRRSETDAIRFISDDPATSALMESTMNVVNTSIGGKFLLVYSSDGMLSFSNKVYQSLSDEDKKKVLELTLKTVKESQLPSKVKVKVTNFVTDQDKERATSIQALNSDTSSELSRGYAWFRPFSGPLSTFLGFLAIVIFVFLSSSIVFDIAFLTIGVFRSFLETEEGKPKLITGEAWDTAKEVDGSLQSGTYRDYISVYFRKRVGIFVLTSIILIYLISGQIYDIFTFSLQIFEEIFQIRG